MEEDAESVQTPETPVAPALGALPERRQHARQPVNLRIMVAIGRTVLHGRAENLSLGGACLRLEEPLPEGMQFALRLLTPYLKAFDHIDVKARVQNLALTSGSPPYRTGVRFLEVDAEARRRIQTLVGD